ncbi:MAG: flagellar biosynthesis repressor FlbT [Azospirillaceae bacterium]|nr:flagellar biosynthesis repressor FlbT [Azospirillaceae bacterium]
MPLKIRLKPREKFAINGAVLTAGDQGATLLLYNRASLLRGKDIMQEEEATSPVKRLYFFIMLMLLDSANRDKYYVSYMKYLTDLISAISLREVKESLIVIHDYVAAGESYQALKLCRALIAVETALLTGTTPPEFPKELKKHFPVTDTEQTP